LYLFRTTEAKYDEVKGQRHQKATKEALAIQHLVNWYLAHTSPGPLITSALLKSHFWNLSLGHKTMRSIPRDQEQLRESKQKKENYPHEAGFGLAPG
jgi:hypothetical protein